MTERRAARLGLAGALVVGLTQLGIGTTWSLTHEDPTYLELTRRCLEREKLIAVDMTVDDTIAESASGGALQASVQGGLVTISVGRDGAEVTRLGDAYAQSGTGERLDVHGRYVYLWLRRPLRYQRQTVYDCAY